MREVWERYARDNPMFYINSLGRPLDQAFHWNSEEFFASGNAVREIVTNLFPQRDWRSARLLEIGCGLGRESAHLASIFGEVVGLDVSSEMVKAARRIHQHRANLTFVQGDGVSLGLFLDASFDAVYSNIVFQHILDVAIVADYLRDAARVLRPGGALVVQLFDRPGAEARSSDVWICTRLGATRARQVLEAVGLRYVRSRGEGTDFLWLVAECEGRLPMAAEHWPALRDSILASPD